MRGPGEGLVLNIQTHGVTCMLAQCLVPSIVF